MILNLLNLLRGVGGRIFLIRRSYIFNNAHRPVKWKMVGYGAFTVALSIGVLGTAWASGPDIGTNWE